MLERNWAALRRRGGRSSRVAALAGAAFGPVRAISESPTVTLSTNRRRYGLRKVGSGFVIAWRMASANLASFASVIAVFPETAACRSNSNSWTAWVRWAFNLCTWSAAPYAIILRPVSFGRRSGRRISCACRARLQSGRATLLRRHGSLPSGCIIAALQCISAWEALSGMGGARAVRGCYSRPTSRFEKLKRHPMSLLPARQSTLLSYFRTSSCRAAASAVSSGRVLHAIAASGAALWAALTTISNSGRLFGGSLRPPPTTTQS